MLAPTLVNVLKAGPEVIKIEPWWLITMLVLEAGALFCWWLVQAIALRAPQLWPVGHLPAGLQRIQPDRPRRRRHRRGAPVPDADRGRDQAGGGGLGSDRVLLLLTGMLFALPILALPAIITGEPIAANLARAAWAGLFAMALMVIGGILLIGRDGLLECDRPHGATHPQRPLSPPSAAVRPARSGSCASAT